MTTTASGIFEYGGLGVSNITVDAWDSSRFGSPPVFNSPTPSGTADATTLTTDGGQPGCWELALPTSDLYYIRALYGGENYWQSFSPSVATGPTGPLGPTGPTGPTGYILTDTALGGGPAATLGSVGATGPATATQNSWLKVNVGGTDVFIPVWQ